MGECRLSGACAEEPRPTSLTTRSSPDQRRRPHPSTGCGLLVRKPQWVLDADIEACFDSIDHTALMNRVRARVKDKRVLALVKAFLKAGVMTETGDREDSA